MEGYFEELPSRGNRELYRYKRGVFLLFERNIEGLLAKSKYTWILTFAQPGCGTCERNVRPTRFTTRLEPPRYLVTSLSSFSAPSARDRSDTSLAEGLHWT